MGAKKKTEVDGVWYESITDACRAVHLNVSSITGIQRKYNITASEAIDMCRYHGVNKSTFYMRMAKGLPLEMCLSQTKFNGGRYPVYKYLKEGE